MSGNCTIVDGRTGRTAEVDELNRLITFSTVQDDRTASSLAGNTFIITHPIINLTSDSESCLLYAKNSDSFPWTLDAINADIGPSTGGAGGMLKNRIVVGVNGGTILTASDALAANTNLGSANPLAGVFKYGGEGITATGAVEPPAGITPSDQRSGSFTLGPIVVTPGTSFAILFTPPTGNTSLDIKVSVALHREVTDA